MFRSLASYVLRARENSFSSDQHWVEVRTSESLLCLEKQTDILTLARECCSKQS